MPTSLNDKELALAVAQLPTVSSVLHRLLVVLNDPDSSLEDVARLVSSETGLAAQVLRLANSPIYALPEPAGSIGEAIQRLGANEVYSMVTALAGKQLVFRSLEAYGISAEKIWLHALTVAVCSELVALSTGTDRGHAFLSGILHTVGMMALDRVMHGRKLAPCDKEASLLEWEHTNFGTDNAAVAAFVLRRWHFPEAISLTVLGRYEPIKAATAIATARTLNVASCMAVSINGGLAHERGFFKPTPERITAAGLEWDSYSDLVVEAGQRLMRQQSLLRLT